jgi:hypothetical protein
MAMAKMPLQGARLLAGSDGRVGRSGSEVSCSSKALRRSLLRSGRGTLRATSILKIKPCSWADDGRRSLVGITTLR